MLFLPREHWEKEDAQTSALHKGYCLAKKRTDCFCYSYNVLFPKRWQEHVCRTHSMPVENNNPLSFLILGRKSTAKKADLNLTRLENLINFG